MSEIQEIVCDPNGLGLTPQEFGEKLKQLYAWMRTTRGAGKAKNYGKGKHGFKPFILRNMRRGTYGNRRRLAENSTRESGFYDV